MRHFNAVLKIPGAWAVSFQDTAHALFSAVSDGYCLGGAVWPHVTLCQFQGAQLPDGIESMSLSCPVYPLTFGVRPGKGAHVGYNWLELVVAKTQAISEAQKKVFSFLNAQGYVSSTEIGDRYHPHITLARVPAHAALPADMEAILSLIIPYPDCPLEFGFSDANGQYFGGHAP